jgi:hypothetical protein
MPRYKAKEARTTMILADASWNKETVKMIISLAGGVAAAGVKSSIFRFFAEYIDSEC